jgi:hypothetical protein
METGVGTEADTKSSEGLVQQLIEEKEALQLQLRRKHTQLIELNIKYLALRERTDLNDRTKTNVSLP